MDVCTAVGFPRFSLLQKHFTLLPKTRASCLGAPFEHPAPSWGTPFKVRSSSGLRTTDSSWFCTSSRHPASPVPADELSLTLVSVWVCVLPPKSSQPESGGSTNNLVYLLLHREIPAVGSSRSLLSQGVRRHLSSSPDYTRLGQQLCLSLGKYLGNRWPANPPSIGFKKNTRRSLRSGHAHVAQAKPRLSFRLPAVVIFRVHVQEPVPNITAHPSTSSILVWHYVLEGPKGSEYEGGFYWGKIEFPSDCESNLTRP